MHETTRANMVKPLLVGGCITLAAAPSCGDCIWLLTAALKLGAWVEFESEAVALAGAKGAGAVAVVVVAFAPAKLLLLLLLFAAPAPLPRS